MATPILPVGINPPDQVGYQYKPGQSFIEVELDGGAPRMRRDKVGMCHYVTCKFSCTEEQYTRLMAFFRESLEDCTLQFRMPLKIDTHHVISYKCQITGEPPSLVENAGLLHVVQAQLKVFPNPILAAAVQLQNITVPEFEAIGVQKATQFPVGRTVQIVGSSAVVSGIAVNLDGFYVISGAPSDTLRQITVPGPLAAAWATLATVPGQTTLLRGGAVVLMPL